MIEIKAGTLEERIIKLLQKTYPITVSEVAKELQMKQSLVYRELQKLQTQGIVQLDPLPGKTFIRLLRNDFSFTKRQSQRKFVKHHRGKKKYRSDDYDGIMYS